MNELLPPDIIRAMAAPGVSTRMGICSSRLSYHEVVTSTNDVALELARFGVPAGTSVAASTQTAGRGRRGRNWISPANIGLYLSVVLDDVLAPTVTLLAGVAVAEAIRVSSGVPVELEWPNDLVLSLAPSDRRAKVGGILTESVTDGEGKIRIVVGIGINLGEGEYQHTLDRSVTWLNAHTIIPACRGVLLVEILCALAHWQDRCVAEGAAPILARWSELSPSSTGNSVGWESSEGSRSGVTDGLNPDGSLRVRVGDRIENIVGGTLDW